MYSGIKKSEPVWRRRRLPTGPVVARAAVGPEGPRAARHAAVGTSVEVQRRAAGRTSGRSRTQAGSTRGVASAADLRQRIVVLRVQTLDAQPGLVQHRPRRTRRAVQRPFPCAKRGK